MCRYAWPLAAVYFLLAFLSPVASGDNPVATEANRRRAEELVSQLGSKIFREREKASAQLIELGEAARPALTRAAKSKDATIAQRAQACLDAINRATRIDADKPQDEPLLK